MKQKTLLQKSNLSPDKLGQAAIKLAIAIQYELDKKLKTLPKIKK